MSLAPGTRIGPYEVVSVLGAGGMGEVYLARDTKLQRNIALKILPEIFASEPERLARFEREARAVAALSHPNILAIHDYGAHDGITYAVMELLEGETLRSRLTKGPLSWRETVKVGAAVAEGLSAAHAKGILHRDLKPENLFLTADGRVAGAVWFRRTPSESSRRPDQAIDSLAVLPLVNASGDSDKEFLSDGITEGLINRLSQLPRLRVIARTTVFRYKNQPADPQAIGQALRVQAVLTGRVTRRGDVVKVQLDLVDATDGTQLWGEQFRTTGADLNALQNQAPRDIAERLRLELTSNQERQLAKRHTQSTEAYHLYLRGRYLRHTHDREAAKTAVALFEKAIAADPAYASAYSSGYAWLLAAQGRLDEAIQRMRRTLELDPMSVRENSNFGWYLYMARRYDAAAEHLGNTLGLDPGYAYTHQLLGRVYEQQGRYPEALAEISKAVTASGGGSTELAALGHAYAVAGRAPEARNVVRELQQTAKQTYVSPYNLAIVHAGLRARVTAC